MTCIIHIGTRTGIIHIVRFKEFKAMQSANRGKLTRKLNINFNAFLRVPFKLESLYFIPGLFNLPGHMSKMTWRAIERKVFFHVSLI